MIDVYVSPRRDMAAAGRFFATAITAHGEPDEVVTDLAQALGTVLEALVSDAFRNTEQHANNRVECDHGRLEARLWPMRGLETDRAARVAIAGHAFMQNVRRGYHGLGVEAEPRLRVADAFSELTGGGLSAPRRERRVAPRDRTTQQRRGGGPRVVWHW